MLTATCHSQSLVFRPNAVVNTVNSEESTLTLDCPMPWLDGPAVQVLGTGGEPIRIEDGWLLQGGETVTGVLLGDARAPLEEESLRLYQRLFELTAGLNRYRIWNFVPRINARIRGVENYVAFNAGRHLAFAGHFGGIHRRDLAAASAVGTTGGHLTLVFTAGTADVEYFENPLQTPSSGYPPRYGKNAPLFARGSRVISAGGPVCWHLSGTAAIRAAETTGSDFASQLGTTLENIACMLDLMAVPASRRAAWKVFLRDRRDLEDCRRRLASAYPDEVAQMMFVEADICRSDLLLEIEGIFHS